MIVRTLSLRQPWAWYVLNGKDIENRRWSTKHRGLFLIHAAKGMTRQEYAFARDFAGFDPPPFEELLRGGIVGATTLLEVIPPGPSGRRWHMQEQYGFVLGPRIELPFRPLKGALSFFSVETTPEESLLLATLRPPVGIPFIPGEDFFL